MTRAHLDDDTPTMDPLAALFLRYRDRADVDALGEVFDRTAPRLLQLAMHLSSRAADAEDLLQATFVLAMQKAAAFDHRQPLQPWLSGILAGEARNLLRKHRRRHAEPLPDLCDPEGSPIAAAERSELLAQLRARIETLPQEQRQVLLLQLQHGLSPAAIAEVLELPPGTVRMRIHRGLQALRKLLPAGLAAWLSGVLPQRGLAAVRQAVLRQAAETPAGALGAGAVGVGIMTMKAWIGIGVGIVLIGLWWCASPSPVRLPDGGGGDPTPVTMVSTAAVDRDEATTSDVVTHDRRAVAAATGALRVRVLFDRDRVPAVGVAVHAGFPGDAASPMLRSDAEGEVRFVRLPPGAAPWLGSVGRLRAFSAAQLPPVVAGAEVAAEVLLSQGGTVDGVVTDDVGRPLAGAEVWIGEDEDDPLLQRLAAHSDAEGRFRVPFETHETAMTVRLDGYCSGWAQSCWEEVGSSVRHFVLHRGGGRIDGTVADANGMPVGAMTVALSSADHLSGRAADGRLLRRPPPRYVESDANGRFAFVGVAAGNYRMRAAAMSGLGQEVAVAANVAVRADVVLPQRLRLFGTVADEQGRPVEAARVHLDSDHGNWTASASTDAQGGYELRAFVGSFWLFARSDAEGTVRQQVQLSGDQRRDLRLAVGSELQGELVDADGQPLRGWHVVLRTRGVDSAAMPTNALGQFRVAAVARDGVSLVVWPPLGDLGSPALVAPVQPGSKPQRLVVPAAALPRASISGRVEGSDGRAARATVTLRRGEESGGSWGCGDDGCFVCTGVPAGDFTLSIEGSGEAPAQLPIRVATSEQRVDVGCIRLPACGRLQLTVERRDGAPWQGPLPWLSLLPVGGDGPRSVVRFDHCVGTSQPVPSGRYRLQCEENDVLLPPACFDIEAGATTRATLAIGIGRSMSLRFTPPEAVPFDAGDALHVELRDAAGSVVEKRDIRRAPRSKPRQYELAVTLPAGSFDVRARTDGGLQFGSRLWIEAKPGPREIEIPLSSR